MSDPCSTHPSRAATGRCVRCAKGTCAMCVVDVDGTLYCSILCFTEQTLASKGKTIRQKPPDPLAAVDFRPSQNLEEPSVVLGSEQAEPEDESSVMMSATAAEDRSETSILDLSTPTKERSDDSSIAPLQSRFKDPTSILGMGSVNDPPKSETPLPMVLPGTRRSTIQSTCVFHPDTPAVVRCSKCGDSICTLCVADEEQGGRCSPRCSRDLRRSRRNRILAGVGAVAALLLVIKIWPSSRPEPPKTDVNAAQIAQAQAAARAAEEKRLEEEAREEAKRRVEARAREEAAAKAEADARAKAEAEAKAKEAALKAEAEAKAAAIARAEAFAKAQAEAKEALAKAEARAAAEAAAKAAKEKAEADARAKAEAEARAKVEAEIRARAAAELKAAEERRAAAEAKAKAEALEKAKAEAEAKARAIEASMKKASDLIREATPAFCSLAEEAASAKDLGLVVTRIDGVASLLSAARSEYVGLIGRVDDHPRLERRIAGIDELLAALGEYRARAAADR